MSAAVAGGTTAPEGHIKHLWIFPGQGSQWTGMGLHLATESPTFAQRLDECAQALEPHTNWKLHDALNNHQLLQRVDVIQPALWAIMVSLAHLWTTHGSHQWWRLGAPVAVVRLGRRPSARRGDGGGGRLGHRPRGGGHPGPAGSGARPLVGAHRSGGGNFGVATRYWFRSPDTEGDEPAELLPTPPARLLVAQLLWPWAMLDEVSFSRLLRNHGEWHERNSGPDSPYAGMYSVIGATPRANGGVVIMSLQMDASLPDAEGLLSAYLAAVREGTDAEPVVLERRELPWLHTTTWPGVSDRADHTKHAKFKSAYLRARLSDDQIGAVYRSLTTPDYANMTAGIMLASYGGAVNTVDPSATAMPQRDSIMRLIFATEWDSPRRTTSI